MATTLDEYKARLREHDMDWDLLPAKDQIRLASFLPCSKLSPTGIGLVVDWGEFWQMPRRGTRRFPQGLG